MIQSLGLTYTLEGDRAFIGTGQQLAAGHKGAIDVTEASEKQSKALTGEGRRPWDYIPPEKLSVANLELAGVARAGNKWKGYAYAIRRKPIVPLFDGQIKTVGAEGVTVQKSGEKAITLPLAK